MKRQRAMSSDSLALVQRMISKVKAELGHFYQNVCDFLPAHTGAKGENATQILDNINKYQRQIEQANKELVILWNRQFPIKDHARAAGMTLYQYRQWRKTHDEDSFPLGNPSSVRTKRKASAKASPPRVG